MKQIISTTLFFVFFWTLHTFVSWILPSIHFLIMVLCWMFIGLISLVFCKFIYDWLERQENGYLPARRRAILFSVFVIVVSSFIGYRFWDNHREKLMGNVLNTYSNPREILIKQSINSRSIQDVEHINELLDFLSQYKVIKTKGVNEYNLSEFYDLSWENTKGHGSPVWVIIRIGKNEVWINMEHYKVTNGPVDFQWLKEYSSTD